MADENKCKIEKTTEKAVEQVKATIEAYDKVVDNVAIYVTTAGDKLSDMKKEFDELNTWISRHGKGLYGGA